MRGVVTHGLTLSLWSSIALWLLGGVLGGVVIYRETPEWELNSQYVTLSTGETIKLRHDPCNESSYMGDIPLSKEEFELLFEKDFTAKNETLSPSLYHDQDGNPRFVPEQTTTTTKGPEEQEPFYFNSENLNNIQAESVDELPSVSSEYISDEPAGNSRHRRAATSIRERLWPNGVIPYVIEGNFTGPQRAMFVRAMRHWQNHTCITFIPRSQEEDYIVFTRRSCGCCSYVGRKSGGSQAISIGKNCDKFGVVVHELGHAVGFWHEHTRPDRDLFITVKYENIMDGQQYNFEKLKPGAIDSLGEPYDYNSIMHYSANTFSKNAYLPTIETKKDPITGYADNIGQRSGLSEGDIKQSNLLYRCKVCGASLIQSEGEFSSPNYPDQYGANIDCEWRIAVTEGEIIGLNISDFDLKNSGDRSCDHDFLEIRDGHFKGSPLIGRYCYNKPPPMHIKSSSERLWLRFKSSYMTDTRNRRRGFKAAYHSICGGYLDAANASLHSPNFPDNYQINKECQWTIRAQDPSRRVGLRFISFEIESQDECNYDYLEIRDANQEPYKLCGQDLPEPMSSSSNELVLIFKSDTSVSKGGFAIDVFEEINECQTNNGNCMHTCIDTVGSYRCECNIGFQLASDGRSCESACGGYINVNSERSGLIASPNYPNLYPNKKHCIWNLVAPAHYKITINFDDFQLEGTTQCKYDYLSVQSSLTENSFPDGIYCGVENPKTYTSTANSLRIVFHTDDSIQKKGFQLTYFADYDECSVNNGGCAHTCRNTKGGFNCSCNEGYVLHHDNKTCKESECQYNLTGKPGVFQSPYYPDNYPKDKECYWRISTSPGHRIGLRFMDFALEDRDDCTFDYVLLIDGPDQNNGQIIGKYCGELNTKSEEPKISYSNVMSVKFLSDQTVTARGFKAEYYVVCGGRLLATSEPQQLFSHALYGDTNYMTGQNCNWVIVAPSGYYVEFEFEHIEVEWEDQCKYDRVSIYDGEMRDNAKQKTTICGEHAPAEPIISNGQALLVVFETDDTLNKKGFSALYTAKPRDSYEMKAFA